MNGVVLIVRLGAMGDIVHTLPAVASLKASWPNMKLAWVLAPRWIPLLEGNPDIDQIVPYERDPFAALRQTWTRLRNLRPEIAVDFQGLIQSALTARAAGARKVLGFARSEAREALAALFYHQRVHAPGPHRVEKYLQLAAAAGATVLRRDGWVPPGRPEGELPQEPFVLTTPFAGWAGKQWPIELLDELGGRLRREGLPLVANVSETRAAELKAWANLNVHVSSIAGLIHAMRRAIAVIAPDSGPMHLAAALQKPGVALFGPTDPASHGPFGGSMQVVRAPGFETTYKRHASPHASMRALAVDDVFQALLDSLSRKEASASS